MQLGAHVRTAGGIATSIARARDLGCESLQIFSSNPRGWQRALPKDEHITAFNAAQEESPLPALFHTQYLINSGSPKPQVYDMSVMTLKFQLQTGDLLNAAGVVTHVGSHMGDGLDQALPRIEAAIGAALAASDTVPLLLENSAGSGGNIGSSFKELGAILRACDNHERIKLCVDTAHAFASGYHVETAEGFDAMLAEIDEEFGLDRLAAFHLNDSKVPFDSHRDRHENIGEGHIGLEAFRYIVNHKALAGIPAVLEVPGFDDKGPDQANMDIVRGLQA